MLTHITTPVQCVFTFLFPFCSILLCNALQIETVAVRLEHIFKNMNQIVLLCCKERHFTVISIVLQVLICLMCILAHRWGTVLLWKWGLWAPIILQIPFFGIHREETTKESPSMAL